MCGIAGVVSRSPSKPSLSPEVLSSLSSRGPDAHGEMSFSSCVLGHTRLSIIDLAGGAQPMANEQNDTAITFNGEIYNYKELRETLKEKGYTFSTTSDTEVILKAYAEYGTDCVQHLDGMFAFAIWDEEKQHLFLARDRFGKKPLYYATAQDGSMYFASEVKALNAAGIRGEIDPAGIDLYLTLMYIPAWRTVYKNIHTLPPAHTGIYKDGELTATQYWKLSPPEKPLSISYEEAKEETRRLFKDAVRKRMIADVEVGALLSGGVDSSLITQYAAPLSNHPLKTFALGYGEYIDELPYAEQLSKAVGTDHYTRTAGSDLTHELERVLAYFDEPHGDSADFPQHLVSELAASKVKVALAGDGGDELFLGYGWYWTYWNRPKIMRIKNFLFSNPFKEHLKNITVFPRRLRGKLWKDGIPSHESIDQSVAGVSGNGIEKINFYDLTTYLPGQLLTKVDRTSMMHSLEIRCPFLDHKLAEFAVSLPEKFKTDRKTGKLILKDLLRKTMPSTFVDRKKQGFGAPVRAWLSEEHMKAFVHDRLGEGAHVYKYLNASVVQELLKSAYATNSPKKMYQLWVLLCLEVWLRTHADTFA